MLNERNEQTKKNIHLMVTSLCYRDCKYCCNKQYDLDSIPTVTDLELKEAENVFITGGEPFDFTNPPQIAKYIKNKYKNIKNVYVYTNALELYRWMEGNNNVLHHINGLTISIKNNRDLRAFEELMYWYDDEILELESNYLYVFDNLYPKYTAVKGFKVLPREWQENFEPAEDSIFRRI